MIFYFSGTGNSAWVARQLAHLTGDVACDITTLAHTPDVQKEEQVGFVFPVYAWGASEVMTNFASKLARPQAFAFSVCTCGSEAGLTMKRFAKEYPLDSSYSLVMLMLTDVLLEGTKILYLGDEDLVEQAFNVKLKEHEAFLPRVMSRKKQVVPMLSALWG